MNRKTFLTSFHLSLAAIVLWPYNLVAQADSQQGKPCGYCGMLTDQFPHSRMVITNDDGSGATLCSLHCAAIEFAVNVDKTPKNIQVGDFNTKQLIDAEKAAWVIVGDKPGVMSRRGKWAFGTQADAQAFVNSNGGKLATFDEAMKAAYEDMHEDTKMIRERRKMKRLKMMEQKSQSTPGRSQ
jgi:copper chaperone NosL